MSDLCVCMRDVISEFYSEIEGSPAPCAPMLLLCYIVCPMCSWSSLHVECIFPSGMSRLSAWRMMPAKTVPAVFMSGGGRMSEKAASVSAVNRVQPAFPQFVNVCLLCCSLHLVRVSIVATMGRWSEFIACTAWQAVQQHCVAGCAAALRGRLCSSTAWQAVQQHCVAGCAAAQRCGDCCDVRRGGLLQRRVRQCPV